MVKKVSSEVATQEWATAYDVGIFKRETRSSKAGVVNVGKQNRSQKRDVIFPDEDAKTGVLDRRRISTQSQDCTCACETWQDFLVINQLNAQILVL